MVYQYQYRPSCQDQKGIQLYLFNSASIAAAAATVSARGVILTFLGGLMAHLLGKELIYGRDI
jgi:hypothetical protein